jgi:hypothetical protein
MNDVPRPDGQDQVGAPTPARNGPQQRMETFLNAHHPKFMYHATKPPVQVFSRREIEQLGPEWSETYVYQEYPKSKYHRTGKILTVKDADEEAALGEGWASSSVGPFGLTDAHPFVVSTNGSSNLYYERRKIRFGRASQLPMRMSLTAGRITILVHGEPRCGRRSSLLRRNT